MNCENDLEILIVDDDRIINLLHSRIVNMSQFVYSHNIFQTAEAALEYLEANVEAGLNFLILLDINMPDMNGWEFMEECHSRNWEQILAVMVTSSIDPKDKERIKEYEQVIFLTEKPLTLQKLMEIFELPELLPFRGKLHE